MCDNSIIIIIIMIIMMIIIIIMIIIIMIIIIITCLLLLWKLLTGIVANEMYEYLDSRPLLPKSKKVVGENQEARMTCYISIEWY